MIYYRKITVGSTAPSSPAWGEIWATPIATSTYQCYIWLNEWALFLSGGVYIAETDADDNYVNVVIQEDTPTNMKPGWIWIKESIAQAYLYIFDFTPLIGV